MGALLGPAIVPGNRVTPLQNGEQFASALIERAHAGVRVHLMLDWVGCEKMSRALIERMRDACVEVVRYHPPKWYGLARLNNRTHRKVLIVDGRVGFTGGVGIADE